MRKSIFILIIIFVLLTSSVIAANHYVATTGNDTSGNGTQAYPWLTIQHAIDNVTASDTIYVANGTYSENVYVNKSINLTGNGYQNTTINSALDSDYVFEVIVNNVSISGFRITGATDDDQAGIYLDSAYYCNVYNNDVSNNFQGIFLASSFNNTISNITSNSSGYIGIYLESSSNNTLTNSIVNANEENGIYLDSSSSNTLINITSNSNTDGGIFLESSSNNTLTNITSNYNSQGIYLDGSSTNTLTENNMSDNTYNLYISGSINSHFNNTIFSNNVIDYSYNVYYNFSISDFEFNSTTASNAGFAACINCNNVTYKNMNLSHDNFYGLFFYNTSNSNVENVISNSNYQGICLKTSSNNTLTNITSNSNEEDGVYLESSSNNTLTNSVMNTNDHYGIYIYPGSNNNCLNNTFSYNLISISLNGGINNNFSNNEGLSNTYNVNGIDSNNYFSDNSIKSLEDDEEALFNQRGTVLVNLNKNGSKLGYELLWKEEFSSSYDDQSTTIYINDILYVNARTYGYIFAVNATTGEQIWRFDVNNTISGFGGPTYYKGIVYDAFDKVWAINATTGEQIWNYTNSSFTYSQNVAVSENYVVAVDFPNPAVIVLNRSNGELIWGKNITTLSNLACEPLLYGDNLLISGLSSDPNLYNYNSTNGDQIWNFTTPGSGFWDSSPILYNNTIYIAGLAGNSKLSAINLSNGQELWYNTITSGTTSTPSIFDEVVYIGLKKTSSIKTFVSAFFASNGTLIWNYSNEIYSGTEDIYSQISIALESLFFTAVQSNMIYSLNKSNGELLWNFQAGSTVYGYPIIANGNLFVNTDDTNVYSFNLGEGGGNWTTLGHNTNRTGYTPDGLTNHKYIETSCETSERITLCNVSNNYDEEMRRIFLDLGENISQAKIGSNYLSYIKGSKVFLPKIEAGETITIEITNGTTYNTSLPQIISLKGDYSSKTTHYYPSFVEVINSTYLSPDNNNISLILNGTGNANLILRMPTSSLNYYAKYDGTECNQSNCNFTQNNGELTFSLTLGSEHILYIYPQPTENPPSTSNSWTTRLNRNTNIEKEKVWKKVNKDQTYKWLFDDFRIINELIFTAEQRSSNAKINIQLLDKKPKETKKLENTYQYINITNKNLKIKQANISFKINKTNTTNKKIILSRYNNNTWKNLETKHVNSDKNYNYYIATTPGFSYFAITTEEIKTQKNKQETIELKEETINETQKITKKTTKEIKKPKEEIKKPNYFLYIIIIIILTIIYLLVKHYKKEKHKNRFYKP